MIENENTMELEINPYDNLIEPVSEPVSSPVIFESSMKQETAAKINESVEVIPLSEQVTYNKIAVKGCVWNETVTIEVEEELLVPDTFPDMETILNMDSVVASADIKTENQKVTVNGKIKLETMYRSAENYGNNISVIPAQVEYQKEVDYKDMESAGQLTVCARIRKVEYRIINERKYKVKLYICIDVRDIREKEHMMFNGLENEPLHVQKKQICLSDLVSQKTKEDEISEDMLINDEKIRPLKILKTKFCIAENHRQLTKEKLVLNQTLWVRILYLAEIASKGNLSNQPVLYHGKIDHTQFIPLGKTESEITSCTVCSHADNLTAEINHQDNGFHIAGDVITAVDLYGTVEKEIVTDFYHDKEEMTCDRKEVSICCEVKDEFVENVLRESISLQQESGQEYRIVYLDTHVIEAIVKNESGTAAVKGKVQLEAAVMNEGDYTILARKICDFECAKEIAGGAGQRIEITDVKVREMTGDVSSGNMVNLTAQLQVQLNIHNEAGVSCISAPCIIRSGEAEKDYPITVYTVKENEELWDIAKKFKVSEECITAVNNAEDIKPGRKIIIVK